MKIIIVGAGAVGSIVAQKLSVENHDVTLIESDEKAVASVQRSLDALVLTGNGASWELLEEAGVDRTDILIAVTNVDEMNILACQQASRYKVKTRVARVRNRDYYLDDKTSSFPGIDHMINPDEEAVREIHELLLQPAATDIYDFADGRVQVIGARVMPGAPGHGQDPAGDPGRGGFALGAGGRDHPRRRIDHPARRRTPARGRSCLPRRSPGQDLRSGADAGASRSRARTTS